MTNDKFPKEEGAEIRTATEEALALATHPKPKRGRKAGTTAKQTRKARTPNPEIEAIKKQANEAIAAAKAAKVQAIKDTRTRASSNGIKVDIQTKWLKRMIQDHRQSLCDCLIAEWNCVPGLALKIPTKQPVPEGGQEA